MPRGESLGPDSSSYKLVSECVCSIKLIVQSLVSDNTRELTTWVYCILECHVLALVHFLKVRCAMKVYRRSKAI